MITTEAERDRVQQVQDFTGVTAEEARRLLRLHGGVEDAIQAFLDGGLPPQPVPPAGSTEPRHIDPLSEDVRMSEAENRTSFVGLSSTDQYPAASLYAPPPGPHPGDSVPPYSGPSWDLMATPTVPSQAQGKFQIAPYQGSANAGTFLYSAGGKDDPIPDDPFEDEPLRGRQRAWSASSGQANKGSPRTNPMIDLTNDDDGDEELRQALELSMADHNQRHHSRERSPAFSGALIGPMLPSDKRDLIDRELTEDELLEQAIAASMALSGPYGEKTGASESARKESLLDLGPVRQRQDGLPVILVPPYPAMRAFSVTLQALLAVEPLRGAISAYPAPLTGIESLPNFWRGAAPVVGQPSSVNPDRQDQATLLRAEELKLTRSLQLLTSFVSGTERVYCSTSDMMQKLSPAFVRQNSVATSRKAIENLCGEYYVSIIQALTTSAKSIAQSSSSSADVDAWNTYERSANHIVFSSGLTASPVMLDDEEATKRCLDESGTKEEGSLLHVKLSATETNVYEALNRMLSTESTLFARAASAFCVQVGLLGEDDPIAPSSLDMSNTTSANVLARSQSSEDQILLQGVTPEVDTELYLDRFMFDKRKGVPIGLAQQGVVQSRSARIEKLRKHKSMLLGGSGQSKSSAVLQDALRYYEQIHDAGDDAVRQGIQRDVITRLRAISEHLVRELERVEETIEVEEKICADAFRILREEIDTEIQAIGKQSIRYLLQSVVFFGGNELWTYVRGSDGTSWWKIKDVVAERVSEETVRSCGVSDGREGSSLGLPLLLFYQPEIVPSFPLPPALDLSEIIREDNELLQSELLSMQADDDDVHGSPATGAVTSEERPESKRAADNSGPTAVADEVMLREENKENVEMSV